MILKTDCKHFPGDRPCSYNKLEGKICNNCEHYSPIGFKILIIKLDAVGDVLRTTAILPALKRKYPNSHITWLTKKNASEIFANNKLVDCVLCFDDASLPFRLQTEEFDLLIHPDSSPASSPLAAIVKSKIKCGFTLDNKGCVVPFSDGAIEWFEMGAFDQVKKKNEKTYQQIIHEIINLEYVKDEIQIHLTDSELSFRNSFVNKHNLKRYKKIVGINTGAGSRWQFKQWRLEGIEFVIEKLIEKKIGVILYGGNEEAERNEYLSQKFPEAINSGTNNTLRQFFALIDIPDLVLTGDTMALHAATALKKKIVCFFGPTSSNEIEDYGRITKIIPDMDCLVCYKMRCDFIPNCMDLISEEKILQAILTNL